MLSFEDLRASFEVPRTSFFLYLRLRSALKCYGVPWGNSLEAHPVIKWFVDFPVRGLVSRIYAKLIANIHRKTPNSKEMGTRAAP